MRCRFLVFICAVFLALPLFGQSVSPLISGLVSGSVTSCQPSTNPTSCVFLTIDPKTNTVGITVAGTFSGTLQFEISADGGATWVSVNATPVPSGTAVSSTTSTGTWTASVGGYSYIRVRCSAYTSGVATVTLNPSQAVIAGSGGGSLSFTDNGTTVSTPEQVKAGTAGGAPAFVDTSIGYLTSAMAVQSSATCTNVTNMSWNIAANKNYVLSCEMPVLFVASAQIQWCIGGPTNLTSGTLSAWGATTAVTAFVEEDVLNQLSYAVLKTTTFAAPGAVSRIYHIKAQIQNGSVASGTPLTLQTAANGTNNIQVLADTACTLTQAN